MSRIGPPKDSLWGMDGDDGQGRPAFYKHAQHRMHDDSFASWREFDAGSRDREVCEALYAIGRPASDREIMHALAQVDPNYVRPSITRMTDSRVLREVDRVTCPETGKLVRRSWFTEGQGVTANIISTQPQRVESAERSGT